MSDYWETVYSSGHLQRYPWDSVVSFVFRYAPHERPRTQVAILEVGFGTGANLWFAAREGFCVTGIEASESAVEAARERFAEERLRGDLRHGSFTELPFEDECFDLIIDRAALTCCTLPEIAVAIEEITRVARPGARFFFNPYADSHSSARSGTALATNVRVDITDGSLAGLDRVAFLSAVEIHELLSRGWRIESLKRLEMTEMRTPSMDIHAEWRVIAERT